MAELATFWAGPITALECACLASFVNVGHVVTLYGFEEPLLPNGVVWRPANKILDYSFVNRFITNGKPNLAHFADLFRLNLFERTGDTWIDADVLCLEPTASHWPRRIIVKEAQGAVINCVFRLDDPTVVAEAQALTLELVDRDLPWAATQNILPRALHKGRKPIALDDPRIYCPIAANDWYKLLLPEHREECERACTDAVTVHIYNNILQKVGYLKSALPPQGSYIRRALDDRKLSEMFAGEYSADVVRNLVDGWSLRFSAGDAGFGAILRQGVPSLKRTLARRRNR